MKKKSPPLYSSSFSFIDLFSHYERITIQNTLLSKINTDFSCKRRADLCDATLQNKTFTHQSFINLSGTVNNKNPLPKKTDFSQPVSLQPIQVFAITDLSCVVFLLSTFTSYKTMGIFNSLRSSYLN
jgi:hypothetical protein